MFKKIMKQKVVLTLLSLSMIFSVVMPFSALAASKEKTVVSVQVNNKQVQFPDAKPYYEDNHVMIPIRFVSEALGADVKYKKETTGTKVERVVYVGLDGKTIRMPVNSIAVLVGDAVVTLDVPARLEGSRVFVPIRFVSEALGAKVSWDQKAQLVSITTGSGTTVVAVPAVDAYGAFDWYAGYTDLAKKIFNGNMKVANGKLTFTLPEGAEGYYEAAWINGKSLGQSVTFVPEKTYTYSLSDQGKFSVSLVYLGRSEQELYTIYFPGTYVNEENNPKLAQAISTMDKSDALVLGYTLNGEKVAGSLSEIIQLAGSLD